MPDSFANFATSTIKGGTAGDGFQLGIGDTTLRVQTADASKFPSTFPCMIMLGTWTGSHELVQCTNRSSNVLTITRAQESTSAAAWVVGTNVESVFTAGNAANKVSKDGDTMTGLLTTPDLALNDATAGALHQTWTAGAADPTNAGTTPAQRRSSTGSALDIIGGTSGVRGIQNNASGYNVLWTFDNNGGTIFSNNGTAQSVASSGTITTSAKPRHIRVTTSGAVTGVIMQAGSADQEVVVINTSANSITMAASGTSHVADGVSCVIAANRAMWFTYDSVGALWYHS